MIACLMVLPLRALCALMSPICICIRTWIPLRSFRGVLSRAKWQDWICDVYNPDGTPFIGDPRYVLKRAVKRAADMGYTFQVGPECEFFLFHTDEEGRPTTQSHERASYFDVSPIDLGENVAQRYCAQSGRYGL